MDTLLGVDLGLRTGLALYDEMGRLIWYRSRHFGTTAQLRDGARAILGGLAALRWLVLEGGNAYGDIWRHEADRRGVEVLQIDAAIWRGRLLYAREQQSGQVAKKSADDLARRVIAWSAAARPTALRHDTAEAILIGLWGALAVGLLPALPGDLRHQQRS
jgi:hypothetical protein